MMWNVLSNALGMDSYLAGFIVKSLLSGLYNSD